MSCVIVLMKMRLQGRAPRANMIEFQRAALVWCVMSSLASVAPGQDFYLKTGDNVIFYGDSDLAGRLYEGFIESYVLTRFPHRDVPFAHAIWNQLGDPASRPDRPTVIVTKPPNGEAAEQAEGARYRDSLRSITASFPQTRLTSLQTGPAPVDRGGGVVTAGGGRTPPAVPVKEGTLPVDVGGLIAAAVEKARAIDPALAATIMANGNPVGQAGQLLMAQAVLQSWHAPALVSAVEINALRGAVVRAENTTVRDMENGRVIAWSQDDQTLPMAVDFTDPAVALAARCSDLVRTLDNQTLRIRGLAAEQYRFTIDGEFQGIFHRDQLETGINLAALPTPMWKQAMEVHALTRKHRELAASRWQLVQAPAEQRKSDEWKSAWEALDAAETDMVNEQRARAMPKTHDYELQPVEH